MSLAWHSSNGKGHCRRRGNLIRREEKFYAKVAAALGAGALILIAISYAILDRLDIF
jgi:hypothetical protein